MHPNNLLEVKRVIREAEVGALARETAAILAETSPEVLSARLAAFVA